MTPPAGMVRGIAQMTQDNDHTTARISIASWCASTVADDKSDKAYFQVLHDAFTGIKIAEIWLTHSTMELCELRYELTKKLFKKMREAGLADAAQIFNKAL